MKSVRKISNYVTIQCVQAELVSISQLLKLSSINLSVLFDFYQMHILILGYIFFAKYEL